MIRLMRARPTARLSQPQFWEAAIVHVSGAEGPPRAEIRWGVEGGKVRMVTRTCQAGKQGRSSLQQLESEIASLAKRKRDKDGYLVAAALPPHSTALDNSLPPLPMLATSYSPSAKLPRGDVYVQPKLDGIRCIADVQTGSLWSRSRNAIQGLDHIAKALVEPCATRSRLLDAQVRYVDGEIYAPGADFQTISSLARRVVNMHDDVSRLKLFVFDAVTPQRAFAERWALLRHWSDTSGGVIDRGLQLVPTRKVSRRDGDDGLGVDPQAELQAHARAGYEGVMFRVSGADDLGESQYRCGTRSRHLMKHKGFLQEEFGVLGINKHRELDTTGAVLLRLEDGRTFSAAPAMSAQAKKDLWEQRHVYLDGKWIASVRFHEVSRLGVPRFPRVVGFRYQDDR
jgi:ATP-dependent DNA ligase